MGRRLKRPARAALAFAVGLVLLELVLQVGSFVVWSTARHAPQALPPGHGEVVLCVGDSFTYGIGASSQQACYPMQLERMLDSAGRGEWTVVNGGWPARSSREVRLRLVEQLRHYAPSLVYVLVGHNDAWERPEPVIEDGGEPDEPGFPLVWRTVRFAKLCAHALFAGPLEQPAFLGTWHGQGGIELTFDASGRLYTASDEMRWHTSGDDLFLDTLALGRVPVAWRRQGEELWLSCALWPEPLTLTPGPAPAGIGGVDAAQRAQREGRLADAEKALEAALADAAQEPAARASLVELLASRRPDRAREHLARLQELARTGDPDARAAEIRALVALGDHALAVARMCGSLREDPESFRSYELLAAAAARGEHRDAVLEALHAAEAATRASRSPRRAYLLSALAVVDGAREPMDTLRWLCEAALLGGDDGPLVRHLRASRGTIRRDTYERVAAKLASTDADCRRLDAAWEQALIERHGAVLETHLRQIVALCRRFGAEPVFLDYPIPVAALDEVLPRLRDELGVGTVAVRAAFERALRTTPREELFASDRVHCNDAGYRLLTGLVLRDALERSGR